MRKVNTNISLDPNIKRDAIKLFSKLGLDLSSAISLFLYQSVRERKIPFEISEVPNKKTIKAINEVDKMMKHPERSKTYDSADELMKDLNN